MIPPAIRTAAIAGLAAAIVGLVGYALLSGTEYEAIALPAMVGCLLVAAAWSYADRPVRPNPHEHVADDELPRPTGRFAREPEGR